MLIICILLIFFLLFALWANSGTWRYIKQIYDLKRMGKLADTQWKIKVEKVCKKWVQKTPVLKLNDGGKNIIDMIFRVNQSTTLQSWQKAGLLLGLNGQDREELYIGTNGQWKEKVVEIDFCLLAQTILKQSNDIMRIKPAMDKVYDLCINRLGEDGLINYRTNMPEVHFVDTVGFTVPFLLLYGKKYNKPEAISVGKEQLKRFIECGLAKNGVPYHAFNRKDGVCLGICGWARGIGWYVFGLLGASIYLDKEDPDYEFFICKLKSLADSLIQHRNEEGGFCWNIFSKGKSETSGTSMIGLLFCEAYRIFREKEYLKAAKSCLNAVMRCTISNGIVYYAQGDSKGMGLYSSEFEEMPFAQGIALLLYKKLECATNSI